MTRISSNSTLFGIIVASLCLLPPAALADGKDVNSYVGTWILNVAKSRFRPGPPMQSETLIITETGGLWHVTDDEHFADGTSDHLEWSTKLNGTNNPITGGPDVDSVTDRLAKSYNATFMKAGRPVIWETARVIDGVMHSSIHGKLPDGTPWKYYLVFERQR